MNSTSTALHANAHALGAPEKDIDQAEAAISAALSTHSGALALPEQFKLHNLEAFLPFRRRAAGKMASPYINDFVAYMASHRDEGCTVFVDADAMTATAVLDLGTPTKPGHCAHTAILKPSATAAYAALLAIINRQLSQKDMAEWLEDWSLFLQAQSDGVPLEVRKAVSAVRDISVEAMKKAQSNVQALSTEQSVLESARASSSHTLPTHLLFTCTPYPDLQTRTFSLRLSVLLDDKPRLILRPAAFEEQVEQMANEFATLIRTAVENTSPVLIGTYTKT